MSLGGAINRAKQQKINKQVGKAGAIVAGGGGGGVRYRSHIMTSKRAVGKGSDTKKEQVFETEPGSPRIGRPAPGQSAWLLPCCCRLD